jgi:hypothetical protein
VRRGDRFPEDQAEVVFSDVFVEQLGGLGTDADREKVLAEIVNLCASPGGKHPLRAPLAGWNTVDVLAAGHRVVYKASVVDGVGVIDVLCLGPRTDNEIYDMAEALDQSGLLSGEEATGLWDALAILEVLEEDVGLDGWDYSPPPAPDGLVRAVVAAGLLDQPTAESLSQPELLAAMEQGFGPTGPDPQAALIAALETARRRAGRPSAAQAAKVVKARRTERCGAVMPRASARCVRRLGHPGPHRSR